MAKAQSIQEFSAGGKVGQIDRENGVVHDVKILGLTSKNGRTYTESAMSKAVGLYEGSKVNVNHPDTKSNSPRQYQDRFGSVHGVYLKDDGLYARDFKFNPKHPVAEQFLYDAEHSPNNAGFSHNVLAKTNGSGKGLVVEEISKVVSIDLVADPATTDGLFEHTETERDMPTLKEWLDENKADEKFVSLIEASGADMAGAVDDEKAAKLKKLIAVEAPKIDDSKTESVDPRVDALTKKIDGLATLVESTTKRSVAIEVLASAGAKISQPLVEELVKLADGKAMTEAVNGWSPAKLGKPRPKVAAYFESTNGGEFPKDHAGFLRELKRR